VTERVFIERSWHRLKDYFADGSDVDPAAIDPRLEVVRSDTWQSDLFRLATLTWSVPVSRGYGRRIRFLVWDHHNTKLIGCIGLCDPVFNLRVRDEFIGWSLRYRQSRLVNLMDGYILGAIPPYSMLLGGKLVASLVRSREVRDVFHKKYARRRGVLSRRKKRPSLVLVTTTSALGKSSVYDRLKLGGLTYFKPVGFTGGWGHFHIPNDIFRMVRQYLNLSGHKYANGNKFGDGPNWRLRAVRQALVLMGGNDDVLNHGIGREVYVCELAQNGREVLTRRDKPRPDFRGLLSVAEISALAKDRWIVPRAHRMPDFSVWTKSHIAEALGVEKRETLHGFGNNLAASASMVL
jgi:hypothetical protein